MKALADYVLVVDGVLPLEEARGVIKEYRRHAGWRSYGGANYARAGEALLISTPEVIGNSPIRKRLADRVLQGFMRALHEYHKKFARTAEGQDFLMVSRSTPIRLLRYASGTALPKHVDKHPDLVPGMQGWPSISISLQLNDDYDGGEFVLLDGERVIRAPAGGAIVFPSNFLYPHEISKVTRGTRYVAVTWFL